jgi:hypothetical protein
MQRRSLCIPGDAAAKARLLLAGPCDGVPFRVWHVACDKEHVDVKVFNLSLSKENFMTKTLQPPCTAKTSIRKNHRNGTDNPLPGRAPSAALLKALKAVEKMGGKKKW